MVVQSLRVVITAILLAVLVPSQASAIETDFDDMDVNVPIVMQDGEFNPEGCIGLPEESICRTLIGVANAADDQKNNLTLEGHGVAQWFVDQGVAWAAGVEYWSQFEVSWGFATLAGDTAQNGGFEATVLDNGVEVESRYLNKDALADAASCTKKKHTERFAEMTDAQAHDPLYVAFMLGKCSTDKESRSILREARHCDGPACAIDILDSLGALPCAGFSADLNNERGAYCNANRSGALTLRGPAEPIAGVQADVDAQLFSMGW